jgi:hypothetical protein
LTIVHATAIGPEDYSVDRNVRRKILWHEIKFSVMEKCISVGSWVKVKVKVGVEGKVRPRNRP